MKKILLLGSGELGKEFAISAKRLGCIVIACDKYENAPAMQVSDSSKVLNMLDGNELRNLVRDVNPDYIVPEVEAIRTEELVKLEKEGKNIVPSARAVNMTMNRDVIRDRAAQMGISTANFYYAVNEDDVKKASEKLGFPCILKPVMSSSGKGQYKIQNLDDCTKAWTHAKKNMRGDRLKVIVEEFIDFESEFTLLTVKQKNRDTIYCPPIGHRQINGDYEESWQPAEIDNNLLIEAKKISKLITDDLGGEGLFGVEFFLKKKEVIFSELSPRPHDTGLVTLFSQDLSEFDLHLRAILGYPIPNIILLRKGYSTVLKAPLDFKIEKNYIIEGLENAFKINNVDIKLFGKPLAWAGRRLGVILSSNKENGLAAKNLISIKSKDYKNI